MHVAVYCMLQNTYKTVHFIISYHYKVNPTLWHIKNMSVELSSKNLVCFMDHSVSLNIYCKSFKVE